MYAQAVDAIEALLLRGENLRIAPQNLIEFWAVATRPAGAPNGLGLTPEQAAQEIARLKQQFPLILDTADVYPEWERLVTTYGVRGRQVYDARLAAIMLVHGITHILTFNGPDFRRYAPEGIVVVDPITVTVHP